MLSKKSFLADERNFLAPLVRPTRGNVRDHIESHKSDRRPSYMPCRGLRRRRQRKTDLREIFGAAQFSTFSTASTLSGSRAFLTSCRCHVAKIFGSDRCRKPARSNRGDG